MSYSRSLRKITIRYTLFHTTIIQQFLALITVNKDDSQTVLTDIKLRVRSNS